jgi:uncharacterized repeat protein (TIGR04052 family)
MPANLTNASALLCAALAFLGAGVSCSAGQSHDPEAQSLGIVTLALETPDGQTIDTMSYVVTNAAGEIVVDDVLDVRSPYATVSVEISLPGGAGYTIAMTATTAEGAKCHGSTAFAVIAGDQVPVDLTLVCGDGGAEGGQVVITTTVLPGASCPEISTATVGPLTVGVGDSIALNGTATEADATLSWSATSGAIADPTAASTTLLCTAVGPAEVTLTVSDTESCSDSETFSIHCVENAQPVPVTIQFAAAVGNQDFACGQTYPNPRMPVQSGQTATPSDFRFYVEDVRLINAAGNDVPITLDIRAPWQSASVALLDFEDGRGSCVNGDVGTNAVITGTVPAGEYVGVAFRNGVPEDLNHDDPTTLEAPLRAPGMHWSWLSGFRFMRAQLMQTRGPAENVFEVGSTGCSGDPVAGTAVCSRPNRNEVRLSNFNPATSTIVADIGAIFAQLNWRRTNECHGTDAVCESMFTAYGVDFETGAALGNQQVYRVE